MAFDPRIRHNSILLRPKKRIIKFNQTSVEHEYAREQARLERLRQRDQHWRKERAMRIFPSPEDKQTVKEREDRAIKECLQWKEELRRKREQEKKEEDEQAEQRAKRSEDLERQRKRAMQRYARQVANTNRKLHADRLEQRRKEQEIARKADIDSQHFMDRFGVNPTY